MKPYENGVLIAGEDRALLENMCRMGLGLTLSEFVDRVNENGYDELNPREYEVVDMFPLGGIEKVSGTFVMV